MVFEDSMVLDLCKNSAVKIEQLQNARLAAHFTAWNQQYAINMACSPNPEPCFPTHQPFSPTHPPCATKHEPCSPKQEPEPLDEHSSSSSIENEIVESNSPQSSSGCTDAHPERARARPRRTAIRDETYLDRRRKNNEAAKKSRDAKRAREKQAKAELVLLKAVNQQLKAAFDNCACGASAFGNAVNYFIQTPCNLPVPYPDPRFIPVRSEFKL